MEDILLLQKSKSMLEKILKIIGYSKINYTSNYSDFETDFVKIAEKCKPFTMTSIERLYSIFKSVEYVVKNNIEGDFVECGVWKGGSAMMLAYSLLNFKSADKKIYLYDTFEGMTEPTENDVNINNVNAKQIYTSKLSKKGESNWVRSEIDEVKQNLYSTCYPKGNIFFIKGKVEETIPKTIPSKIAILRLDTDWYESTLHELKHLYPLLVTRGVLVIDDYGHWLGCKKAIDEYFSLNSVQMLLNRVDYTCRTGIKF